MRIETFEAGLRLRLDELSQTAKQHGAMDLYLHLLDSPDVSPAARTEIMKAWDKFNGKRRL